MEAVQRSKEEVSPPRDVQGPAPPPPPPPDPPYRKQNVTIRIGDVDVPLRKPIQPGPIEYKQERRKATKSGVTEEARKVLEQFLKHSFEQKVSAPFRHERQTLSEREYVEECPYMYLQSNESYYGNRLYGLRRDVFEKGFLTDGQEPLFFNEPDYAEPAEPEDEEEEEDFEQIPETQEDIDAALGHKNVSKTNSISSQSSFGLGPRSNPASRNRSPSDKLFLSVHPHPYPHPHLHSHPHSHLHRGHPKVKAKRHKELFDESSTSTEDYEYTENYLVSRKKKSFFKWASERLRQSFRRSNKLPPSLHEQLHAAKESVPTIEEQIVLGDESSTGTKSKKNKNKNKLKFNLKRNGSEKGSKSSSTPNEVLFEAQGSQQECAQASESDSVLLLRTEDTVDQGQPPPERTERRRKSPVPWKRYEIKPKKKEAPPVDTGPIKEKGIFDSFLKHIRKGSSKLKRKGSKEESVRQRSRSADNLVLQPLSKEHEKVLQRYVSVHKKDAEYDSDSTTVRSFHEVLTHRVDQQSLPPLPKPSVVWYPPPLPPEPVTGQDGGSSPLRRPVHLEGLVPCHDDGKVVEHEYLLQSEQVEQLDIHDKDGDISLLREIKEQQRIHRTKPSESEDDVDGGPHLGLLRKPRPRRLKVRPLDVVNKPFHERTELEKDELYEKIAEQLAAIADQYNFESPRSSKSLSSPTSHTHSRCCSHTHSRSHSHSAPSQSETEEGAVGISEEKACPLRCGAGVQAMEERLGALIKERGDSSSEMTSEIPPMMAELVRNASYSQFKQMFNENIGNEPGWEQIAMMFRLTQTAVQLAGFGTAVALQIKEMTLKYFEDKFAGWIVGQGGWESVVENDSELD